MANALLGAMAQATVWGLYHNGKLAAPFVVNDDKTLETLDGGRIGLLGPHWVSDFQQLLGMVVPKPFKDRKRDVEVRIGLIHPVHLSAEQRQLWLDKLKARKVAQVVDQLGRPVVSPSEDEQSAQMSYRFEHCEVDGSTFKSRAARLGWRRGSVIDSGAISGYFKHFPQDDIDAFVTIDDLAVGETYKKAKLKTLFFVPHGSVVTGSYTYDEPRDEKDERLIAPPQVPQVVFTETVGSVNRLLGRS